MTSIYKKDGIDILNFLEKTLKIQFGQEGFLAGQSVCSAFLYLKGINKKLFVNDLDIFLPKQNLNKNEIIKSTIKQNLLLHSMVDRAGNFNQNYSLKNSHIKNLKNFNLDLSNKLKRSEIWKNKYFKYIDDNNILFNKDEYSHLLSNSIFENVKSQHTFYKDKTLYFNSSTKRRVFDSVKKNIFNYIYIEGFPRNNLKILNDFDINCTQIGIDLKTKQLFYTNHFINFLKTLQLEIVQPDTPFHSIIRLFKKQNELGYKSSLEFESLYISTLLGSINFSDNLIENKNLRISKYCFGDIYLNKYKKSETIPNYFSIYSYKKEAEEIKNYRKEKNRKFLDYNLYRLNSKIDKFSYINDGIHKEEMEKTLNVKIKGYDNFLLYNLKNIMKDKINKDKKTYSFVKDFNEINKLDQSLYNSNTIYRERGNVELKSDIFSYYSKFNDDISINDIEHIMAAINKKPFIEKYKYYFLNIKDFIYFCNFCISNKDLLIEYYIIKKEDKNVINNVKRYIAGLTSSSKRYKNIHTKNCWNKTFNNLPENILEINNDYLLKYFNLTFNSYLKEYYISLTNKKSTLLHLREGEGEVGLLLINKGDYFYLEKSFFIKTNINSINNAITFCENNNVKYINSLYKLKNNLEFFKNNKF